MSILWILSETSQAEEEKREKKKENIA